MEIQSSSGMSQMNQMDQMRHQNQMQQAEEKASKQMFGAQVVEKTLDYMNSSNGTTDADYDFQKSVLGSYTANSTLIINELV
ncbi:MAG: hypothetical protein ACOCV7_02135 [Desulfonatronovibrionaceae bacterium]